MSIIIEGMEMPKTPVLFCVHPDGKVFADLEGEWREYKAVPVPPHGRCIDVAAVSLEGGPYEYDEWCKWALEQYLDAPTIISATK